MHNKTINTNLVISARKEYKSYINTNYKYIVISAKDIFTTLYYIYTHGIHALNRNNNLIR